MRVTLQVTAGPLAGSEFSFDRHDVFLVGRSPNAHCRLPEDDPYFSRVHFLVEVNPPRCRLLDMGSRNGTFVNGRRVEAFELQDSDEIRAGHTRLKVRVKRTDEDLLLPGHFADDDVGETKEDLEIGQLPSLPTTTPKPPRHEDTSDFRQQETGSADVIIGIVPPRIPGFELVKELGSGTMGMVYLAQRQKDGAEVAIKTIHPSEAENPLSVKRFLRESEVLRQLDHPNVVRFFDGGQAGRLLYFVMEYVRGTDVGKVLQEKPRVELKTAIRITIQVLDALAHAHAKGMVHRDIKPGNVLLYEMPDGKRQVKLADFGLARVYRASALSGLTLYGDLGGTPAYMPPEQITNYSTVTPAADQYSTAAMLYHMLTGSWIFDLPPMPGGLMMILNKEPIPLTKRQNEVALPAGLEPVIHKALAKDPKERYRDVVAFRQALFPFAK